MNNILVAKSFQELPILGDVFTESGKTYIMVQCKNGRERKVRTYTAKEYMKMYPGEVVKESKAKPWDKYYKSQKITLGFEKGYITIYKGITEENEDFFRLAPTRHCRFWGWYLPSGESALEQLPEGVTAVTLPAGDVIWDEEDWLIDDEDAIMAYVNKFLEV